MIYISQFDWHIFSHSVCFKTNTYFFMEILYTCFHTFNNCKKLRQLSSICSIIHNLFRLFHKFFYVNLSSSLFQLLFLISCKQFTFLKLQWINFRSIKLQHLLIELNIMISNLIVVLPYTSLNFFL